MDYLTRAKKFKTKKRLGQNFLVDENVINTIIEQAELKPDDTVLEIGPGAGFVTEKLAQGAQQVVAVELDEDAVKVIKKLPYNNINVINQDILTVDFEKILDKPAKIVANIPYYITSPILSHILGEIDQPECKNRELTTEIILMVQYEVAKRLTANEKSPAKEYGLLSLLVNYWCETKFICKVPANSFYPPPKVDSAVVKLKLRTTPPIKPQNPTLFRQITQAAFGMRRKTIKNALVMKGFDAEKVNSALEKLNISPSRRGETLSLQEFSDLSDCF